MNITKVITKKVQIFIDSIDVKGVDIKKVKDLNVVKSRDALFATYGIVKNKFDAALIVASLERKGYSAIVELNDKKTYNIIIKIPDKCLETIFG